jgi:hypothetical protein
MTRSGSNSNSSYEHLMTEPNRTFGGMSGSWSGIRPKAEWYHVFGRGIVMPKTANHPIIEGVYD